MSRAMMLILVMVILYVPGTWTVNPFLQCFLARQDAIPLDMSPKSVDNAYLGCKERMLKKVLETKHDVGMISSKEVIKCCKDNQRFGEQFNLIDKHIWALCLYTSNCIYKEFNRAVRNEKSEYLTTLKFHALHFLLTDTIQRLKEKQDKCVTAYRRTNLPFVGKVNQVFRFGFFASSSLRTDLTKFGTTTCFVIKTCSGAQLKSFSVFEDEKEVLIPPYEMFEISDTTKGTHTTIPDCRKVYNLMSVGIQSNLNCQL